MQTLSGQSVLGCSAWPEIFALLFPAIFPTDRALIFPRQSQHVLPEHESHLKGEEKTRLPRAPEHLLSPCPISSTPEPPEHLRALLELLSISSRDYTQSVHKPQLLRAS